MHPPNTISDILTQREDIWSQDVFGHVKDNCNSKSKCKHCGETNHSVTIHCPEADSPPSCANCNGSHFPIYPECPFKIKQKISFSEAKQIIEQESHVPEPQEFPFLNKDSHHAKLSQNQMSSQTNMNYSFTEAYAILNSIRFILDNNLSPCCIYSESKSVIESLISLYYFEHFFEFSKKSWFNNSYSSRFKIVSINRLRANHYNLNSKSCSFCDCVFQDAEHIFWHCPKFDDQRVVLERELSKARYSKPFNLELFLKYPKNDACKILCNFLQACDLFIFSNSITQSN
ncbi:hypothetical protein TSAR_012244 [Trichomalopsis sarcophagae]|uniref:Uncharacterized protein n=1 Tax=Trichomalopsis sarcophagae TaxID=543379 RepID=A0A232F2G7_9HYME|nr:hypothetical protein TSAR_012244 [Trichomalopsis sarcophagae]